MGIQKCSLKQAMDNIYYKNGVYNISVYNKSETYKIHVINKSTLHLVFNNGSDIVVPWNHWYIHDDTYTLEVNDYNCFLWLHFNTINKKINFKEDFIKKLVDVKNNQLDHIYNSQWFFDNIVGDDYSDNKKYYTNTLYYNVV